MSTPKIEVLPIELRRGWWSDENKNWRVRYLYSPEKLRQIARSYMLKTEMIIPDV
jgi:hypothetical protein